MKWWLVAILCAAPAAGEVLYVRAGAGAGGDGKSWARAWPELRTALAAAKPGDSIWVAEGTYYPTGGGDREASFVLRERVAVYGGFAGGETRLGQRDAERHRTVLSGDIGKRGVDGDNAFHVVRGANRAVLEGFVIRDGYSAQAGPPPGPGGGPIHVTPQQLLGGAGNGAGAGMLNYQVAPTVRNCVFEHNRAGKGGGVYNMTSTSFPPRPGAGGAVPVFVNCVFRENYAVGRGAGVSNDLGTSPVFLNCIFENNETPQKGGGMYNDFGSSPVAINSLFRGNQAESAAGMGNDGGSSPILLRCTFTGNHAKNLGPALYQGTGPANNPAVIDSAIEGNTCDWEGTGIYNWHDNTPRIEGAGPGYTPGDARFTEAKLDDLLAGLRRYRAAMRPPPPPAAAESRTPSSERIVYVNGSLGAKGDGKSWAGAYRSLHHALEDAARDGAEIWVAAGTYLPSPAGREASFALRPGVRLFGGFQGTETQRDARDWEKNATTLSCEIGDPARGEDNCYHVLIGANGAVVDGFTITGGHADGAGYDGKGGGLINYRRGPQERPNLPQISGYSTEVRNCVFTRNYARDGGAVYSYDRAKPRFVKCTFRDNRADNGGAVLDRVGVEAVYEDCRFTGNRAQWRGGAAYFDYGSRPRITGAVFHGNFTGGHGGAIYSLSRASQLENTVVTLVRCRFENNTAAGDGGGAAFDDSSLARLEDCEFVTNRALRNGGAVSLTNRSSMDSARLRLGRNSAAGSGPDVFREPAPMLRLN